MPNNLSDALKAAKQDRQVLSKTMIWESGVSKSQFYRIINGEESPSLETKQKMAASLGVTCDEFDVLQKQSKPELKQNSDTASASSSLPPKSQQPKNKWLLLTGVLSLALIAATALAVVGLNGRSDPIPNKVVAVLEDTTLFITDVTIPDGTSIPVNTSFVKTWRVQNTGNVVWKDRYLQRITPASSLICASPMRVPIPETNPGDIIDISVTFRTPYLPGSCRTDWKTADKDGNIYFPDMHGLYSIVTVVAE